MPRYEKNFLDAVILEVKFEDVSLTPITPFKEQLKEIFPIQKQEKALEGIVNFDFQKGVFEQSKIDKAVWALDTEDNKKQLRISQDFINLTYSGDSYTDSGVLQNDVQEMVEKFLNTFEVKIINRIGLRYVNVIPATYNDEKPGLNELICSDLISGYSFTKNSSGASGIARAMSNQVLKYDDCDMNFSFGVWNNDFPNRIIEEDFILDLDCYTSLPLASSELNIVETIRSFNSHIETIFEKSIKQKVREWMRVINE